jgi:exodeoxyribonuclease V gamma subunit
MQSVGLAIYRSSRLEGLLDPLITLLDGMPPAEVLAPQTVIAAHPGMRHWLGTRLAERRGRRGVVANLDIVLPSDWLDGLARRVLGASAIALAPYRRERLRWLVHDRLPRIDHPQLAAYLRDDHGGRRRFQLAERIARQYTRYLVYRPDWLAAWGAGRDDLPEPTFLAPLWRQLRQRIDLPHRGERLQALVGALRRGADSGDDGPLHLFGLSHLAPAELAVLRAVATRRLVVLYLPDPCREHWAGIRDDRQALRERLRQDAFGIDAEAWFLDHGHPLLGRWGRMGQHFMLALQDSDDVAIDLRDHRDAADEQPAETLLQRVQQSLRELDCSRVAAVAASPQDRSLRVHGCHTRLRELEVLRDALLRERAERPDLLPSEMVVMAPDIGRYVPLLPAVFGEAGRHDGALPYHLADVPLARGHPLLAAWRRLLALPEARLSAPELVDLLAMPAIARRFGLAGDDVEILIGWLRGARVAWGLDAAFRERCGVPAISAHTFGWGLDRLLGGYLVGGDGVDELVLADGERLAPLEGAHGPQAALLGALDRLLCELSGLLEDAGGRRRASQWAARLEARMEALLQVDPADREGRDARQALRQAIRALATEPQAAGLDPELEFAVVRDLLFEQLDAPAERQRFLLGGVTFCGMVPQRAIPFRVVAVLGLDDGAFPRSDPNGAQDPMARHRRLGDRDARSDDRYLFLETLMAARDVLHLSHVGEGVRDGKPRNPAAPLAELLAFLDDCHGIDGDSPRPWRVQHPLQPFDVRYFDGSDPRLYSYRTEFAALAAPPGPAPAPFLALAGAWPSAPPPADTVGLRELIAFFRDPARQVLTQRLKLRLEALDDDRLLASEPLEARFDAIDGVTRRLFLDCARRAAREVPEAAPPWLALTGLLPPGHAGRRAWQLERERVAELLARVAGHPLFIGGLPPAVGLPVDRTFAGVRVVGQLDRVHPRDGVRWLFELFPKAQKESELGFRERLPLFLEWALLQLDGGPEVRLCVPLGGREQPWLDGLSRWNDACRAAAPAARAGMLDDLRARLAELVGFHLTSQQRPGCYFPRSSWEAATRGIAAAALRWQGSGGDFGRVGERDYAPGYARLLAGGLELAPGTPDADALLAIAGRLHALIGLDVEPVAEPA